MKMLWIKPVSLIVPVMNTSQTLNVQMRMPDSRAAAIVLLFTGQIGLVTAIPFNVTDI